MYVLASFIAKKILKPPERKEKRNAFCSDTVMLLYHRQGRYPHKRVQHYHHMSTSSSNISSSSTSSPLISQDEARLLRAELALARKEMANLKAQLPHDTTDPQIQKQISYTSCIPSNTEAERCPPIKTHWISTSKKR
jgi:hypothetical protein